MKYVCFGRHPCRHTVATERQHIYILTYNWTMSNSKFQVLGPKKSCIFFHLALTCFQTRKDGEMRGEEEKYIVKIKDKR